MLTEHLYSSLALHIRATLHWPHGLGDLQINVGGFPSSNLQPSGTFCNLWWRLAQMLIFVDLFKQFPFELVYVYSTKSSRKWSTNILEGMHREQANRSTCQPGICHDPWRCSRRYILAPKHDLYVFEISPHSIAKMQPCCQQHDMPFMSVHVVECAEKQGLALVCFMVLGCEV